MGNVVIPAQFAYVGAFASNGLAAASIGDRWGFINSSGEFVIEPRFDGAGDFSEGLAAVNIGPRLGFIDESGEIVIEPMFAPLNEVPGLYELSGRSAPWIFPDNYQLISPYSFSEGYAAVRVGGLYKYIDRDGNQLADLLTDDAGPFSEGLAAVESDGKWGYINVDGDLAIDYEFVNAKPFLDGIAIVGKGIGNVAIDQDGEKVINWNTEPTGPFREGLAVAMRDGVWGYLDKTGTWRISPRFEDARTFSEGLAAVMVNGKWGFIDSSGNFKIPATLNVSYSAVTYAGREGPRTYQIGGFLNGAASIGDASSGLFGLIDRDGTWLVKPTYQFLGDCHEGLARFRGDPPDLTSGLPSAFGFISCG